jgi:hypothetical protein
MSINLGTYRYTNPSPSNSTSLKSFPNSNYSPNQIITLPQPPRPQKLRTSKTHPTHMINLTPQFLTLPINDNVTNDGQKLKCLKRPVEPQPNQHIRQRRLHAKPLATSRTQIHKTNQALVLSLNFKPRF